MMNHIRSFELCKIRLGSKTAKVAGLKFTIKLFPMLIPWKCLDINFYLIPI